MSVKLHLSAFFLLYAENKNLVEVYGSNLGECLGNLVSLFPNIKDRLFTSNGALQPYIQIVVNAETDGTTDMAQQIQPGDDIYVYANPRCC
jgi:hypothetical protein